MNRHLTSWIFRNAFKSVTQFNKRCTHHNSISKLAATSKLSSFNESSEKYHHLNVNSPVMVWNEWDPLEEIIVGIEEESIIPEPKHEVLAVTDRPDMFINHGGKHWKDVIGDDYWKKIHSNVQELVTVLEGEGVTVRRPDVMDHSKTCVTPFFESKGFDAACPRDLLLVVGDEIIESNMSWRSRYFEFMPYRRIILDYWRRGAKWTAAPKCCFYEGLIDENYEIPDEFGDVQEEETYVLTEMEPAFDAADVVRLGTDLIAQRSQVTNSAGIEWLRRHMAPKGIRVHEVTFGDPFAMHIDCTMFPLQPGVFMCNPHYECKQKEMFLKAGWNFYNVDKIGERELEYFTYSYLCMNIVMLDEKRAIVEAREEGMMKFLARFGIKSIPVNFYYAQMMGGSFHCWTSDTRRKGTLQSYL